MHITHGRCVDCKRLFWWTGKMTDCPPCGCGRRHTREDILLARKQQRIDEAAERLRRRGVV